MKHLVYILLGLMLVGVFSCGRSPGGTEARLVAIDSLITAKPDSALALLADINADSLPADLRAYHDVLTTQALYKAYIPATTDTLIARAWSYYRDHGPYDRRIRAMLYSGTTAEELGHPDSAMRWYKRTELESRPDDHYHRAYAQEKMALLYKGVFEVRHSIQKFKLALTEFESANDTLNILFCYLSLAQLFSDIDGDSMYYYGRQMQKIALNSKHLEFLPPFNKIVGIHLFYENQFDKAKDFLLLSINSSKSTTNETLYLLSLSYAELNQSDSAHFYLKIAGNPANISDSILYYQALNKMSISKNDYLNAIRYDKKSNNIAADKLRIKKENLLQIIEFEEIKAFQQKKHHRNLFLLGKIILIIFIILLIGFICTYLMARKRHKSLKREIDDLQIFLDKLQKHNLVLQSKYDEIIDQQKSSHVIESNNNEQRSDTVFLMTIN